MTRAPIMPHPNEPLAVPIREACRLTSISRSGIYRLAAQGRVTMLKHGRTTLTPYASLKELLATLPSTTKSA